MRLKLTRYLLYSLGFFCIQCSSLPQNIWTQTQHPKALDNAVYLKDQKKWDQAEAEVRSYLVQTQDLYWQGAALLLLAEVQEGQQQFSQAQETYEQLLNHLGYDGLHVSKALYHLSWLDERNQDCQRMIIHLTDLQKRSWKEDQFVKSVESPARLANCYYWMGQWDKAQNYRETAVKNYIHFKAKDVPGDVFWRAPLYMNYVGIQTQAIVERHYQEIITQGQKALLQLAEQAPPPFNSVAEERLIDLYSEYLGQILNRSMPSSIEERNEENKRKLQDLATFVDLFEELKSYQSIEGFAQHSVAEFYSRLQAMDHKARTVAHQLEMGMQKEKKRAGKK